MKHNPVTYVHAEPNHEADLLRHKRIMHNGEITLSVNKCESINMSEIMVYLAMLIQQLIKSYVFGS